MAKKKNKKSKSKKRRGAPSTDRSGGGLRLVEGAPDIEDTSLPGSPQPHAWDTNDSNLEQLARAVGLTDRSAPAARRAVKRMLSSKAEVRRLLLTCPPLTVLLVEVILEAGGRVENDELALELWRRAGSPADAESFDQALHYLCDHSGLGIALTNSYDDKFTGVTDLSAAHLASMVEGSSLPSNAPAADTQGTDALRDTLAVVALTGHRKLRFTKMRDPNRTDRKTFVKKLGLTPERAGELLLGAQGAGLVAARDGKYVPDGAAMRAAAVAAAGLLLQRDFGMRVDPSWWQGESWISLEALARGLRRESRPYLQRGVAQTVGGIADHLAARAGLEVAECEGERWVRPSTTHRQDRPSRGDGHVTPSFEVMLGPAADLDLVCDVALGCELVRFDRVLTFRITPDSVKAGALSGVSAEALVSALDAVGPRPAPDNVRRLVQEWSGDLRVGGVRTGQFLFLPEDVDDLGTFAAHVSGRPAPRALQVRLDTPEAAIDALFSKHGWQRADTHSIEGVIRLDGHELDAHKPPPPLELRLTQGADRDVRALVERGRRDQFSIELCGHQEASPRLPAPEGSALPPALAKLLEGGVDGDFDHDFEVNLNAALSETSPAFFAFQNRLRALLEGAPGQELATFLKHQPDGEAAVREVMSDPLESVPFLTMLPKWRRRITKEARSFAHLVQLSHELTTHERLSPAGRELAKLSEQMQGALGFPGLNGETEQGPTLPPKADFPRLGRAQVLEMLETAHSSELPVSALVGASAGAARVRLFGIEGFQDRPKGRVVLVVDLLTDMASVVELGHVRSAMMFLDPV